MLIPAQIRSDIQRPGVTSGLVCGRRAKKEAQTQIAVSYYFVENRTVLRRGYFHADLLNELVSAKS